MARSKRAILLRCSYFGQLCPARCGAKIAGSFFELSPLSPFLADYQAAGPRAVLAGLR